MAGELTTISVDGIEYGLVCSEATCAKHQGVYPIDAEDAALILAGRVGRIDRHVAWLKQRRVVRYAWEEPT